MAATLPHIQPAQEADANEGGSDGHFTINKDIPDETINVNVAIAGTATEGADYDPIPRTITAAAGDG